MIDFSLISRAILLSALIFTESNAQSIRTCTNVRKLDDLKRVIHEETHSIILICPFDLSDANPIDIMRSNITIVCSKKKSSDVCLLRGTQRHMNVWAHGVTIVGFDFSNAKSAAVRVNSNSVSFVDCSFTK